MNGLRFMAANASQFMAEVAAQIDANAAKDVLLSEKDKRIVELEAEVAALKPKPEIIDTGGHSPPVVVP